MTPADPRPPRAVCPYCGSDPLIITADIFHIGPWIMQSVFCSNDACRKSLAINCVGIENTPAAAGRLILADKVLN